MISLLDEFDGLAAALALRNKEESVAHQAFRNVLGSLKQATDLQIDAGAQLLDVGFWRQGAFRKRGQKADSNPPERPCRRCILGSLDVAYRAQHFTDAAAILRIAQPGQQALLKASTLLAQEFLEFTARHFRCECFAARRAHVEIGEEQVGSRHALNTAQMLNFLVKSEQAQRLVGMAGYQIIQIATDGLQAAMRQINR